MIEPCKLEWSTMFTKIVSYKTSDNCETVYKHCRASCSHHDSNSEYVIFGSTFLTTKPYPSTPTFRNRLRGIMIKYYTFYTDSYNIFSAFAKQKSYLFQQSMTRQRLFCNRIYQLQILEPGIWRIRLRT